MISEGGCWHQHAWVLTGAKSSSPKGSPAAEALWPPLLNFPGDSARHLSASHILPFTNQHKGGSFKEFTALVEKSANLQKQKILSPLLTNKKGRTKRNPTGTLWLPQCNKVQFKPLVSLATLPGFNPIWFGTLCSWFFALQEAAGTARAKHWPILPRVHTHTKLCSFLGSGFADEFSHLQHFRLFVKISPESLQQLKHQGRC